MLQNLSSMSNLFKILLVEDDEINAKLVRDFLTFKEYKVKVINNGLEVVKEIESDRPDLILLDIQIFGKSGIDVAEDIRRNSSINTIPIIAVSAFSRNKVLLDNQDDLFDEYIEKPIRFGEFLVVIESYLGKERG